MIPSGRSARARLTPGRPRRGCFGRSGRFGFCPFDGGRLELSGVFGGAPSLASNSVIRALSASICPCCAKIKPIRSSLDRKWRLSRFMDPVNRSVRYRVKRNLRTAAPNRGRMSNGGG